MGPGSTCGACATEQCIVHIVSDPTSTLRLRAPSDGFVPVSITVWGVSGDAVSDGLTVQLTQGGSTTLCALGPAEAAQVWFFVCGGAGDGLLLTMPDALRTGGRRIIVKACVRPGEHELDNKPALLKFAA